MVEKYEKICNKIIYLISLKNSNVNSDNNGYMKIKIKENSDDDLFTIKK